MKHIPIATLLFLFFISCTVNDKPQQKNINYNSLTNVLMKAYNSGQARRGEIQTITNANSEEAKEIYKTTRKTDSINKIIVTGIIDKYGWIPSSKIGEDASEGLFYVIQHSDSACIAKYLPLLWEAAIKGNAKMCDAAMMQDRLLLYGSKKQIFGTQGWDTPDKYGSTLTKIWPISDPAHVNELRRLVGLNGTVEENATRLNAVYNPNEKLPSVQWKFNK